MVRIITQNSPQHQPRRVRTAVQKAAQAELKAVRDAKSERRRDTRRKVVIGAALMALADHDDEAARMLERLKRTLPRDADRKLFEE